MRRRALFTALAACGFTVALGVPTVMATAVTHESSSMRGTMAEASWFSEDEVPIGTPRAIAVVGSDARVVTHVNGSAPVREQQPTLVAMALMLPPERPGGRPVPAEVWGLATEDAFTYERDLSIARVRFDCLAEVFVPDPVTGEETPTGEKIPLTVRARWTATSDLMLERWNDRTSLASEWFRDFGRTWVRPEARTRVTITGPEGVIFAGRMNKGSILSGAQSSMHHAR